MLIAAFLSVSLPQTPAAAAVRVVDEAIRGKPTELAVLGTAHLSELGPRFSPVRLEPLLERLARWRPDVITTEDGTGRDCDEVKARPELWGKETSRRCEAVFAARTAFGVDQHGAEKAFGEALGRAGPRDGAARRRLAGLFMGAGEIGSALVQWLRLPVAERRAADGLTPALVAYLERVRTSPNETYALAAVLAARLGLERLHGTDDQSGGAHVAVLGQDYGSRLTAIWDNPHAGAAAAERDTRNGAFLNGGDVLAWYRWLNAPETLVGQMRADFAAAAADGGADDTGRLYLAYWETRNLRMVANMRFAFGDRPGARVLSIVGSSHKPYFERYFATQSDVRIVDVAELLR